MPTTSLKVYTIALLCSEWRLMLSPPGAWPTTTDRGTEIFSTSVIFAVVLPPKVTEIRLSIDIICTTIRTRMKSMMLLGQRFDEKWWWWKNVTLSHQWYTYSRKGYRPPLKTNRKTVAFMFLFLARMNMQNKLIIWLKNFTNDPQYHKIWTFLSIHNLCECD